MHREILIACLPFLLAILAALAGLRGLVWLSGARLQLSRLADLHRDQKGGVQSLSFVLTLPLFIMLLMILVQLSQLTIARIVVEYAAFAAARSAIVWIPANLGPQSNEPENRIGSYVFRQSVQDENGQTYAEYEVEPDGPKFNKIQFAAATACMSICPSPDYGISRAHPGNAAAAALLKSYYAYAPTAVANARIPSRLRNKLAYALNNTHIRIWVRHKDEEPELIRHDIGPRPEEFASNEIGWQDQIVVTVRHDFALLPGPGRLLARSLSPLAPGTGPGGGGAAPTRLASSATVPVVSPGSGSNQRVFSYPLTATVRLNNVGEKSLLPYVQQVHFGTPESPPSSPPPPCNCK